MKTRRTGNDQENSHYVVIFKHTALLTKDKRWKSTKDNNNKKTQIKANPLQQSDDFKTYLVSANTSRDVYSRVSTVKYLIFI